MRRCRIHPHCELVMTLAGIVTCLQCQKDANRERVIVTKSIVAQTESSELQHVE